ncbi:hypothetical protein GUJ93_ZPchr0001g31114 [Zizania palustris]|uniref:Uncharacterized protein n=1 Tax=Zizania palustris TaxID=103762 RepID=A0A8J5S4F2_ZIZPA|nr:hypothetical protein GUJ93_ZPchr0001g31114 [Zizania palustris]
MRGKIHYNKDNPSWLHDNRTIKTLAEFVSLSTSLQNGSFERLVVVVEYWNLGLDDARMPSSEAKLSDGFLVEIPSASRMPYKSIRRGRCVSRRSRNGGPP